MTELFPSLTMVEQHDDEDDSDSRNTRSSTTGY